MAYRPITDIWMLCRPKVAYYGAYPSGFLERARYLLGVTIFDPVLHVCGGKVKDYQSGPMRGKGLGPNDRTVDLDPEVEPDFLLDVRKLGTSAGDVFPHWTPADTVQRGLMPDQPEFRHIETGMYEVESGGEGVFSTHSGADRRPWAASLIDRPYTEEDAGNYNVGSDVLPSLNDLLKRALAVTRIGGRVGVLDYYFPRPPTTGVTLVACIGVTVGWGNRMRCFSVFERTAANPLEFNTMTGTEQEAEIEQDSEEEVIAEPTPVETEPVTIHVDSGAAPPKRRRKKKAAKAPVMKKKKPRSSAMDGFA